MNNENAERDVALAEYAMIAEARGLSHQGSGARYNFHLAAMAALVAAIAVILTADSMPGSRRWTVSGILLVVAVLGASTFLRLVRFTVTQDRYKFALNNMRGRLAHLAPATAELMVLTGYARDVDRRNATTDSSEWLQLLSSLAGSVAAMNAAAFGFLVYTVVGWGRIGIGSALAAGFGGLAYALQILYERIAVSSAWEKLKHDPAGIQL